MHSQEAIERLLEAQAGGDRVALDALLPLVYDELRRLAHRRLRGERRGHTLDTTALVHEAYLKLVRLDRMNWRGRAHFLALVAMVMRNILVDYAVRRRRQKRGGGWQRVTLDADALHAQSSLDDVLALDEALRRLEALDPRQARVVECRFFGGLNVEETAHVLGVSPATVYRDWAIARAWLNRALRAESTEHDVRGTP